MLLHLLTATINSYPYYQQVMRLFVSIYAIKVFRTYLFVLNSWKWTKILVQRLIISYMLLYKVNNKNYLRGWTLIISGLTLTTGGESAVHGKEEGGVGLHTSSSISFTWICWPPTSSPLTWQDENALLTLENITITWLLFWPES